MKYKLSEAQTLPGRPVLQRTSVILLHLQSYEVIQWVGIPPRKKTLDYQNTLFNVKEEKLISITTREACLVFIRSRRQVRRLIHERLV